jgi:hypothetical protein
VRTDPFPSVKSKLSTAILIYGSLSIWIYAAELKLDSTQPQYPGQPVAIPMSILNSETEAINLAFLPGPQEAVKFVVDSDGSNKGFLYKAAASSIGPQQIEKINPGEAFKWISYVTNKIEFKEPGDYSLQVTVNTLQFKNGNGSTAFHKIVLLKLSAMIHILPLNAQALRGQISALANKIKLAPDSDARREDVRFLMAYDDPTLDDALFDVFSGSSLPIQNEMINLSPSLKDGGDSFLKKIAASNSSSDIISRAKSMLDDIEHRAK